MLNTIITWKSENTDLCGIFAFDRDKLEATDAFAKFAELASCGGYIFAVGDRIDIEECNGDFDTETYEYVDRVIPCFDPNAYDELSVLGGVPMWARKTE